MRCYMQSTEHLPGIPQVLENCELLQVVICHVVIWHSASYFLVFIFAFSFLSLNYSPFQ